MLKYINNICFETKKEFLSKVIEMYKKGTLCVSKNNEFKHKVKLAKINKDRTVLYLTLDNGKKIEYEI